MPERTTIQLPTSLDLASLDALEQEVTRAQGVIVLVGAGNGVFCTGLDVASTANVTAQEKRLGLRCFERTILHLLSGPNPAIALVDGDALGGGLGLAAACDVLIATPTARVGLPEPLFGLIPGMITPVLRTRVSGPTIRRLALSGASVSIETMRHSGLVDQVVEPAELDKAANTWTRQFQRAYPPAVGRLKRWLSEMDDVAGQVKTGATHLAELLEDPEVLRRSERFKAGQTPWGDE